MSDRDDFNGDTPTYPGPHVDPRVRQELVDLELADTHDEGKPAAAPPDRTIRLRTRTPEAVSAELVTELCGVRRQVAALTDRVVVIEARTAPKKPWRRRARALLLAVPVSAVIAAAVYAVNAVADARVAAAADARVLLEHAQMLIDVAWLKTQVAVLDAAIDLLKLIRGLP